MQKKFLSFVKVWQPQSVLRCYLYRQCTECVTFFSNSYVLWHKRCVMLRFVAVPPTHSNGRLFWLGLKFSIFGNTENNEHSRSIFQYEINFWNLKLFCGPIWPLSTWWVKYRRTVHSHLCGTQNTWHQRGNLVTEDAKNLFPASYTVTSRDINFRYPTWWRRLNSYMYI